MGYSLRTGLIGLSLWAGMSGCASCPRKIRTALRQPAPERIAAVARDYTVGCPDQLTIQIADRPDLSKTVAIGADGCIALPDLGQIRVEGATATDIASVVARTLRRSATDVTISIAEHASRYVLVIGPGEESKRTLAYIGPETVTDLLRRTGGLDPSTAYHAVHVVRPHVATGRRPEVFQVDLQAILEKADGQSDITLEPYDQIYLGETRGASICRSLPPWLRALLPAMKELDGPIEP